MAMRDKDDHKSPAGGNGAASAKSPTQVSRFTENVPPKVRDAGARAVLLDQRGVPLTLDGRFIADGGNDGHRTSLRKEPLGHCVWDRGWACPVAENPYVPEMWAFVRWHVPESAAAAAGIMNRAPARNTMVTRAWTWVLSWWPSR